MTKRFRPFLLAAGLFVSVHALAEVGVDAPWIRATVPAQTSTGAFMQIKSDKPVRMVAVRSPVAGRVEIHQMEMQGATMRMHAVDGIDLPAGQAVNLAAGGYHVMLFDLRRQLKEGEQVPMTLSFVGAGNKRESVTVQVPVKPLNFAGAPAGH